MMTGMIVGVGIGFALGVGFCVATSRRLFVWLEFMSRERRGVVKMQLKIAEEERRAQQLSVLARNEKQADRWAK